MLWHVTRYYEETKMNDLAGWKVWGCYGNAFSIFDMHISDFDSKTSFEWICLVGSHNIQFYDL